MMMESSQWIPVASAAAAGGVIALVVSRMLSQYEVSSQSSELTVNSGSSKCRNKLAEKNRWNLEMPPSLPQRAIEAFDGITMPPAWEGFSLEDISKHASSAKAKAAAVTPEEVLAELQRGNTRFWMGASLRPHQSAFERCALVSSQYPNVAVIGCSDSRVPVELVFDCGIGDIFVIRVAGNCLDTSVQASVQYAINHLSVKVLVVLGHEGCGAVKAASFSLDKIEQEPAELSTMLKSIKSGLNSPPSCDACPRAQEREAIVLNVQNQLESLKQDLNVTNKIKSGELIVIGAHYAMSSGVVDFFAKN